MRRLRWLRERPRDLARSGHPAGRPVVVLPDRGPAPESDPAWSPQVLRRLVAVDLADARLAEARAEHAPASAVSLLSARLRAARIEHAEALLVAGAELPDGVPDEVLADLVARGVATSPDVLRAARIDLTAPVHRDPGTQGHRSLPPPRPASHDSAALVDRPREAP